MNGDSIDRTVEKLIKAARVADWQQVRLNRGVPCFHLEVDGKFCLRGQDWPGHALRAPSMNPEIHTFVPLDALLREVAK